VIKPPQLLQAVKEYRRAIEVLKGEPVHQQEYKRSLVQLTQLLIALAYKDPDSQEDTKANCRELLRMDPNSFDGFRLLGDFNFKLFMMESLREPNAGDAYLSTALEFYRKADVIKPGDRGVSLQIGQVLNQQKHTVEAEPYFRKAIDLDRSSAGAYTRLYHIYVAEGKTSEAEQMLQEAIRNVPDQAADLEKLRQRH